MYRLNPDNEKQYTDFLNIPPETVMDRLLKINKWKNEQKKIVLYLKDRFDVPTHRYRVYNMINALKCSGDWEATFANRNEIPYFNTIIDDLSVIVIVRMECDNQIEEFITKCKDKSIPVAMDLDDMVYDLDELDLLLESTQIFDREKWEKSVSLIDKTAQMSDCYIAVTPFLQEKLKMKYQKKCYRIQNFLNEEQEKISNELLKQKCRLDAYENPFVLGYFSGTATHNRDFNCFAPAIKKFLALHEDSCLKVTGQITLPQILHDEYYNKRILYRPLTNYLMLQKEIAEVDVNLAPLVVNDFTNCKSELKYFEAGISGTISCVSATEIYKSVVTKETGYLCNENDILTSLEEIYENRKNQYERMQSLHDTISLKYGLEYQTKDIVDVLERIQNE